MADLFCESNKFCLFRLNIGLTTFNLSLYRVLANKGKNLNDNRIINLNEFLDI